MVPVMRLNNVEALSMKVMGWNSTLLGKCLGSTGWLGAAIASEARTDMLGSELLVLEI